MHNGLQIILGRSQTDCDVVLQDDAVSRKHLQLNIANAEQVTLLDLGSTHGSFYWNGEEWEPFSQVTLSANDYIYIGNVKLRLMEVLIAYQIKQRRGLV